MSDNKLVKTLTDAAGITGLAAGVVYKVPNYPSTGRSGGTGPEGPPKIAFQIIRIS